MTPPPDGAAVNLESNVSSSGPIGRKEERMKKTFFTCTKVNGYSIGLVL